MPEGIDTEGIPRLLLSPLFNDGNPVPRVRADRDPSFDREGIRDMQCVLRFPNESSGVAIETERSPRDTSHTFEMAGDVSRTGRHGFQGGIAIRLIERPACDGTLVCCFGGT